MPTAHLRLETSANLVGIQRAQQAIAGLRGAVDGLSRVGAIVGGITSGVMAGFAHQVIGAADAIGDLSDQLQISTDDVQRLQILAGRTGVSFDKFAQALSRVGDARQKALGGDAAASAFFARYGVNGQMLTDQSKNTLHLLQQIGAVLANGITAADQAALLDNLGKGADRLASALAQIDSIGPVKLIEEADIKAMGQAADAIDELKRQVMVAAAPNVGFFGRVLGRMNDDPDAMSFGTATRHRTPFVDSFFESVVKELFDGGPDSTGPLSAAEITAARLKRKPLSVAKSKADDALERRAAELEFGLLDSTEKAARLASTIQAVTAAMSGMSDGPERLRLHVARLEMRKELNGLGGNSASHDFNVFGSAPRIAGAAQGMFQSTAAYRAAFDGGHYQQAAVDLLRRILQATERQTEHIKEAI